MRIFQGTAVLAWVPGHQIVGFLMSFKLRGCIGPMAKNRKKRTAVTPAFRSFHKDYDELTRWLVFIYKLAESSDKATKISSEALLPHETDKEKIRKLKRSARYGGGAMKQFDKHRKLLRELFSVRLVDSYLCYITDLLTILHKNRIELLNLKSTISLAEVLTFENLEDMHGHLIEKRVLDLSYKGIGELNDELLSRLNFPIFKDTDEETKIVQIIEVRNLLVHNRGKINRRFISRTDGDMGQLGKTVDLGNPMDKLQLIYTHTFRVDQEARKKFGIRSISFIPAGQIAVWLTDT